LKPGGARVSSVRLQLTAGTMMRFFFTSVSHDSMSTSTTNCELRPVCTRCFSSSLCCHRAAFAAASAARRAPPLPGEAFAAKAAGAAAFGGGSTTRFASAGAMGFSSSCCSVCWSTTEIKGSHSRPSAGSLPAASPAPSGRRAHSTVPKPSFTSAA
jgi:hypothetical protein